MGGDIFLQDNPKAVSEEVTLGQRAGQREAMAYVSRGGELSGKRAPPVSVVGKREDQRGGLRGWSSTSKGKMIGHEARERTNAWSCGPSWGRQWQEM